jgi:selenocysteine lyase/cysteine desulfurase
MLPWRESICDVVVIGEDHSTGTMDLAELEQRLQEYKDRPLRIGSFSAASNVTGILLDTNKITKLCHQYGALAFWDYASAAPYVKVDVNPVVVGEDISSLAKDAVFISPHKFVGGVGTPGILIAKKVLFDKKLPPVNSGGGTVDFVTDKDHAYLTKIHEREEGGTPDIVGCIRAGLTFQLKAAVGPALIMEKERSFVKRALEFWGRNPYIQLLGPATSERVSIISFVIWHHSGRMLHYNFVCALLNDLFGIQCRGGCVCAGPYGQQLLGINYDTAKRIETQLTDFDDAEVLRPGFVRLSFNYFQDEREFDFVLKAVDFVARLGWKLLPHYTFMAETNEWQHGKNARKLPGRKWLGDISFSAAGIKYPKRIPEKATLDSLPAYMEEAERQVREAVIDYERSNLVESLEAEQQMLRDDAEEVRWFVYPSEVFNRRVEIDEKENNYRNPEWRKSVAAISPFVPFLYDSVANIPTHGVPESDTPDGVSHQHTPANGSTTQVITSGSTVCADGSCSTSAACCVKPVRTSVKTLVQERQNEKAEAKARGKNADAAKGEVWLPGKPWKKVRKERTHSPAEEIGHHVYNMMRRAIRDFNLIRPGDRVMIGVSGGKDSLTMLHMFMRLRESSPFKFDLAAVTIDPQTAEFDPSPLKPYMQSLGITYFYDAQPLIDIACDVGPTSICSWCSRMKRGILHNICEREGYNVLCLGQHLDDLAESFLMYGFHNGKLDTMKAETVVRGGKLRIVRPYVLFTHTSHSLF